MVVGVPSVRLADRAGCSFHLVRNPETLQKLKREVAAVPTGVDIGRDQIQKLPFLRCCLNESEYH